jgi:hypothetical protein
MVDQKDSWTIFVDSKNLPFSLLKMLPPVTVRASFAVMSNDDDNAFRQNHNQQSIVATLFEN